MLPQRTLNKGKDNVNYILLDTSDIITQNIKEFGAWGHLEIFLCKTMLSSAMRGAIVIDVGANIGSFTAPIANCLTEINGMIHSFEPQRIVFQQLCANVFFNGLDNVYMHNVALADCEAWIDIPELDFRKSRNVGGFSMDGNIRSLVDQKIGKSNVKHPRIPDFHVKQICLDSLNLFGNVTFLKVDVEGCELEFFMGAQQTLQHNSFPPIFFESWGFDWYQEKSEKTDQYLIDMGYEITILSGDNKLAQHPSFPCYLKITELGDGKIHANVR